MITSIIRFNCVICKYDFFLTRNQYHTLFPIICHGCVKKGEIFHQRERSPDIVNFSIDLLIKLSNENEKILYDASDRGRIEKMCEILERKKIAVFKMEIESFYKYSSYYRDEYDISFYRIIFNAKYSSRIIFNDTKDIKTVEDIKSFMFINFQIKFDTEFIRNNPDIFFPFIYRIVGNRNNQLKSMDSESLRQIFLFDVKYLLRQSIKSNLKYIGFFIFAVLDGRIPIFLEEESIMIRIKSEKRSNNFDKWKGISRGNLYDNRRFYINSTDDKINMDADVLVANSYYYKEDIINSKAKLMKVMIEVKYYPKNLEYIEFYRGSMFPIPPVIGLSILENRYNQSKIFPNTIKYLNINSYDITDKIKLPPLLRYLSCRNIDVSSLPESLRYISCGELKVKGPIPSGLKGIEYFVTNKSDEITKLEKLIIYDGPYLWLESKVLKIVVYMDIDGYVKIPNTETLGLFSEKSLANWEDSFIPSSVKNLILRNFLVNIPSNVKILNIVSSDIYPSEEYLSEIKLLTYTEYGMIHQQIMDVKD